MSDSELKYPEWQQPYEAALLEFDPEKLARLVDETETVIFLRLQALASSPDGHVERQAIQHACNTLLTLKRDILKFPDCIEPKESEAAFEPE